MQFAGTHNDAQASLAIDFPDRNDLSTVGQMDDYIESLLSGHTAMRKIAMALEARIAGERSKRNALLPLHALPVEVFIYVLYLCMEAEVSDAYLDHRYPPKYYARLRELEGVSVYWKDILSTHIKRFALIARPDLPLEVTTNALTAPSGTCLAIYCDLRHQSGLELWGKALPNAWRMKSVSLRAGTMQSLQNAACDVAAPELQQLDIISDQWSLERSAPLDLLERPLFQGNTPRLRYVSFFLAQNPFDLTQLHQLVKLSVNRCRFTTLSFDALIDILSLNVHLESLDLALIYFGDLTAPSGTQIAELPQLKELKLDGGLLPLSRHLVTRIRAPQPQTLSITNTMEPSIDTPECVLEGLSSWSGQMRHILQRAASVSLFIAGDWVGLDFCLKEAVPAIRNPLRISFRCDFHVDLFQWTLREFGDAIADRKCKFHVLLRNLPENPAELVAWLIKLIRKPSFLKFECPVRS